MSCRKKGFTLIELMVVLIIIGILAAVALPNYNKIKERAIDKEAIANLKLIQAAEKIYKLEMAEYCGSNDVMEINGDLKLDLTEANWDYSTNGRGQGFAKRSGRTWTLPINTENAQCSGVCQ